MLATNLEIDDFSLSSHFTNFTSYISYLFLLCLLLRLTGMIDPIVRDQCPAQELKGPPGVEEQGC